MPKHHRLTFDIVVQEKIKNMEVMRTAGCLEEILEHISTEKFKVVKAKFMLNVTKHYDVNEDGSLKDFSKQVEALSDAFDQLSDCDSLEKEA